MGVEVSESVYDLVSLLLAIEVMLEEVSGRARMGGLGVEERSFEGAVRMLFSPRQLWLSSQAFVLSYLRAPGNLPASAVQIQE